MVGRVKEGVKLDRNEMERSEGNDEVENVRVGMKRERYRNKQHGRSCKGGSEAGRK